MATRGRAGSIQLYLEVGRRRVFACALDWPGWCRSGRSDELALEALAAYAPRYAAVARHAGSAFPADAGTSFQVVERLAGGPTTDFGAPAEIATTDADPLTAKAAARMAALVAASWVVFDDIAADTPAELRKGPRGGGRDRDRMIEHVLNAEVAYARKLGVKHRPSSPDDRPAIMAMRTDIAAVLGRPTDGSPPIPNGWPPRYAARRIAWHALDHAWEMQDRTIPGS